MARQVCEENKLIYSDDNPTPMQTHLANQIQGFVSDPEMFNLTAGMEMIGFHKNLQQQQQETDHIHNNAVMWKSFIAKPGNQGQQHLPSPSYQHDEYNNTQNNSNNNNSENLMVVVGAHDSVSAQWQDNNRLIVDDSSLRCVFPCEGNERPSQGLSLSLSSNNPSSIGLQSFELRQTTTHHHDQEMLQQQQQQEGYNGHFMLKNSKYLVPAQELLNEFCSLDTKHGDLLLKQKSQKNMQWEEDSGGGSSSSKKHSLTSLEFAELQKRKTKLFSMLEEVYMFFFHSLKTLPSLKYVKSYK